VFRHNDWSSVVFTHAKCLIKYQPISNDFVRVGMHEYELLGKIRSSAQRSTYAARRASLAVDRLITAVSRAERIKASSWAKAWGMRASMLK
jgi:hypothetical protein